MRYLHEKGTDMAHPEEHSPQGGRRREGVLATLRTRFHGRVKDACSLCAAFLRTRHITHNRSALARLILVGGCVVVGIALFSSIAAVPALSSSAPPRLKPELHVEQVFATRAYLEDILFSELSPSEIEQGAVLKWRTELTTEPENPTSWAVVGSGVDRGTFGSGGWQLEWESAVLGEVGKGGTGSQPTIFLHHLKPSTPYYARFVDETEHGRAEKTFKFKTLALGKPEIAKKRRGEEGEIGEGEIGNKSTFQIAGELTSTSDAFTADIESNGSETQYTFEYTTEPGNAASWKQFTSGGSGSISVAEDFAEPVAKLTGLSPETTYYVRVKAANHCNPAKPTEECAVVQEQYFQTETPLSSFTTPTARARVETPAELRNITGTSVYVTGRFETSGSETHWRLEYSSASNNGPWNVIPGAEGVVTQAEAEAIPYQISSLGEAELASLSPNTTYYVRVFAKNAVGEASDPNGEHIAVFKTEGSPPTASTLAVHALHGETPRIIGVVDPNSTPTSSEQTVTIGGAPTGGTFTLSFDGQTTVPIAFDAPADGGEDKSVEEALQALSTLGLDSVSVKGKAGGPYRIYFGKQHGPFQGREAPVLSADGSGLSPSGSVSVGVVLRGGEAYDTHYHFEYVSRRQYEVSGGEGGFAHAVKTAPVDLGSGFSGVAVGQDLPGLQAGETYEYRVVASSDAPGDAVVDGETQSLTVPTVPAVEESNPCPNEQFRVGPSSALPDCRAYEQVTPVDKEGAQELLKLGPLSVESGVLVGEDGDHVMVENPSVNWGAGPGAGQSPYFFSRTSSGWQMTAAAVQPETGLDTVLPLVFSSDLSEVGLESSYNTGGVVSKDIEFKAGPPGGPYAAVVVPKAKAGKGWVAGSPDLGKLILQSADHNLVGEHASGTKEGEDLYEYVEGTLRQVNVDSQGKTIGTCGANIVLGHQERGEKSEVSAHAVSSDGSRVFFEAAPASNCEAKNLYMRVNGAETVDIGAYEFVGATPTGSEVLLAKQSGESPGLYLYDTESAKTEYLPNSAGVVVKEAIVSTDLNAVYFESDASLPGSGAPAGEGGIYRYDIRSRSLSYLVSALGTIAWHISGDGEYFYFLSNGVGGVPGGVGTLNPDSTDNALQLYRYDNAEDVIECASCASPYDQAPKLGAYFGNANGKGGIHLALSGTPQYSVSSSNGDFVFFYTAAALVPQDVDGEIEPEAFTATSKYLSWEVSPSSDVYEWRRAGVDGCAHVQGCLALITSGQGGLQNMLLGVGDEGRDVFVYTHAQLVSQDDDSAGDVYDVRIDGGFPPPPPRPTECEGDACSTPPAAPLDSTPSSLTFTGVGNVAPAPAAKPAVKAKKAAKKSKKTAKKRKKSRRSKSVGKGGAGRNKRRGK